MENVTRNVSGYNTHLTIRFSGRPRKRAAAELKRWAAQVKSMPRIWTLGGPNRRTQFEYSGSVATGATLHYTGSPRVSSEFFRAILHHFNGRTVPGGFSMTDPTPGGLGEWVQAHSAELNGCSLSPRHASFIAAILVSERLITSHLEGNAVILRFVAP